MLAHPSVIKRPVIEWPAGARDGRLRARALADCLSAGASRPPARDAYDRPALARVTELVDVAGLKLAVERRAGSSPAPGHHAFCVPRSRDAWPGEYARSAGRRSAHFPTTILSMTPQAGSRMRSLASRCWPDCASSSAAADDLPVSRARGTGQPREIDRQLLRPDDQGAAAQPRSTSASPSRGGSPGRRPRHLAAGLGGLRSSTPPAAAT